MDLKIKIATRIFLVLVDVAINNDDEEFMQMLIDGPNDDRIFIGLVARLQQRIEKQQNETQ